MSQAREQVEDGSGPARGPEGLPLRGALGLSAAALLVGAAASVGVMGWHLLAYLRAEEVRGIDFLLGWTWHPGHGGGPAAGVLSLVAGSALVAAIAVLAAWPAAVLTAAHLAEFAGPEARRVWTRALGAFSWIPPVGFACFGLAVLGPLIAWAAPTLAHRNTLAAGLSVGLFVLPAAALGALSALSGVGVGVRDAGLALGATRAEVFRRVVIPACRQRLSGVALLTASRAWGEAVIVTLVASGRAGLAHRVQGDELSLAEYVTRSALEMPVERGPWDHAPYAVAMVMWAIAAGLWLWGGRRLGLGVGLGLGQGGEP